MIIRRLISLVAAVPLLLTACTGRGHHSPSPDPRSAWEQIAAQLGPGGAVSADTALQAFALLYGPIPGVTPPSGPSGEVFSGSLAIEWAMQHLDDMTDEQRRAVLDRLGLVPGTVPVQPGGGQHSLLAPTEPDFKPQRCEQSQTEGSGTTSLTHLRADLASVRAIVERKLSLKLDARFIVCKSTTPAAPTESDDGSTVDADTVAFFHADGSLDCRLTVYPAGLTFGEPDLEALIGHEFMHCMNQRIVADARGRTVPGGRFHLPAWVSEGIPEWVASSLAPQAGFIAGWWRDYLSSPLQRLDSRTYDAVGFFAQVQHARGGMAKLVKKIVGTDGGTVPEESSNAFAAAVGDDPAVVLDSWPASFLQDDSRGGPVDGVPPWSVEAPVRRPLVFADTIEVGNDPQPVGLLRTQPWTGSVAKISISADVVQLYLGGTTPMYGRFGPGSTGDFPLEDATTRTFCTKAGGCQCPQDEPNDVHFTQIEPGVGYVALTGGEQAASVAAEGMSLESFCAEHPERCHRAAGNGPCDSGAGRGSPSTPSTPSSPQDGLLPGTCPAAFGGYPLYHAKRQDAFGILFCDYIDPADPQHISGYGVTYFSDRPAVCAPYVENDPPPNGPCPPVPH